MRDVMVFEARVALPRPLLQPGDVVPDELAAVLVVADEAIEAVDVLVQPDGVEVVPAEIPEGLDGRARIVGEAADPPLLCRGEQVLGEVGAFQRLLERLVRGRGVLPPHVGAERLGPSSSTSAAAGRHPQIARRGSWRSSCSTTCRMMAIGSPAGPDLLRPKSRMIS